MPCRRPSTWPSSSSPRCSSSSGCRPSNWTLLGGDKGLNFPKNFTAIAKQPRCSGRPSSFTIEYTVIVTVLLIGLGLGLALLVQESGRWSGFLRTSFLLPGAIGLATASLLFWGFYSPTIGPISPPLEQLGLINEPIQFLGTSLSALLSTTFLIVWKYAGLLHADPARRSPGDPVRGVRGRRDRRRDALADAAAASRCRCCGRRSPWP